MSAEDRGPGALPSVEIVRGTPTEEDLAALAGVLPAAYAEETVDATADEPTAHDAWSRSTRLRAPFDRGTWARFSG